LSRLASGEARVQQAILAAAEELDALGLAARRPLALQQELRLLEDAAVVERVVQQPRTEEAVDTALQAHAALAFDLAKLAVVSQEFAERSEERRVGEGGEE